MAQHNDLGDWGEDLAAKYLESKDYYILRRDWRYGHRDLDIIAMADEQTLVIVEVKTRSNERFADAVTAVDKQKIHSLTIAANAFIRMANIHADVRFDIITVVGTSPETAVVTHIPNAFLPY